MSEFENEQSGGVSRRTVTRAMAWAVPAVAVASSVPIASASNPTCTIENANDDPRVQLNICDTCGNTGQSNKGCVSSLSQYWQTPVLLSNPSTTDTLIFHVTSMTLGGVEQGAAGGAYGVYASVSPYTSKDCGAPDQSCNTGIGACTFAKNPAAYVCLAPNAPQTPYWVVSNQYGNSSSTSISISWELVKASDCSVVATGTTAAVYSGPPNNCTGKQPR